MQCCWGFYKRRNWQKHYLKYIILASKAAFQSQTSGTKIMMPVVRYFPPPPAERGSSTTSGYFTARCWLMIQPMFPPVLSLIRDAPWTLNAVFVRFILCSCILHCFALLPLQTDDTPTDWHFHGLHEGKKRKRKKHLSDGNQLFSFWTWLFGFFVDVRVCRKFPKHKQTNYYFSSQLIVNFFKYFF